MKFEGWIIWSIVNLLAKTRYRHDWTRIALLQKMDPNKYYAHNNLISLKLLLISQDIAGLVFFANKGTIQKLLDQNLTILYIYYSL